MRESWSEWLLVAVIVGCLLAVGFVSGPAAGASVDDGLVADRPFTVDGQSPIDEGVDDGAPPDNESSGDVSDSGAETHSDKESGSETPVSPTAELEREDIEKQTKPAASASAGVTSASSGFASKSSGETSVSPAAELEREDVGKRTKPAASSSSGVTSASGGFAANKSSGETSVSPAAELEREDVEKPNSTKTSSSPSASSVTASSDYLEPDDSRSSATVVSPGESYTGLTIESGDQDYFAVDVSEGAVINTTIYFDHDDADVDMELIAPDGSSVDFSASVSDNERIVHTADQSGTYYIRVYPFSGAPAPYDFELSGTTGGGDYLEPDDSESTATEVSLSDVYTGLTIESGDPDYFAVDVSEGAVINSTIYFDHDDADIDMELIAPDGSTVELSTSVSDNERIVHTADQSGTYYIRVYPFSGAPAPYDFQINGTPDTDGYLEPDGSQSTATEVSLTDAYSGVTIASGDEDYFAVDVSEGAEIDTTIYFDHDDADVDMELIAPDGSTVEVAASVSDNERIVHTADQSGTYYIRVYPFSGAPATYDFELSGSPDPGGGSSSIGLSDASGGAGSSVTLTLSADADNVAGYRTELQFDPGTLDFAGASGVDLSDPITNVDSSAGNVVLTQSGTSGVDDPTLATITFDVSSSASSGSYPVDFVESGTSLNSPTTSLGIGTYDDGEVTVSACTPGDADTNGVLETIDATQILRYVAGLSTVGSFDASCADITGDGAVTALDATQVLRSVAGFSTAAESSATTAAEPAVTTTAESDVPVSSTSGQLTVGSASGSAGSTVTVPLSVTGGSVASYQANITFDPSVVEFVSASGVDFSDPIVNPDNSAGHVFLTQAEAGTTDSPTLADLTFRVTGSSGASTQLSLVPSDTQVSDTSGRLSVGITNGSISLPGGSASFDVSSLSVPSSVARGDTASVSATVTNTGSTSGTASVDLRSDGSTVDSTSVSLSAGASQTVSFSLDTSGLSTGDHTIAVATADASSSATLSVTSSGSGGGATGIASVTRMTPASVSTSGTATVVVEATMSSAGGALSLNEEFSGAVTGVTVDSVTVDGASVSPIIARANENAAIVTLSGVSPSATVEVTYEVEAAASAGTITISGNVSSDGTTNVGTDTLSVTACSLPSVVQTYDSDGDCGISLTELGRASADFANADITLTQLGQVSTAFANS